MRSIAAVFHLKDGGVKSPRGTSMRMIDAAMALGLTVLASAAFAQSLPPPSDVKAPPADAKKTPSGLAYKVIKPGTGTRHPASTSSVTVHYTGWTTDGKMFDSSVSRGQPATFPLNRVIAGWTEGLQLMTEGEKTRFW